MTRRAAVAGVSIVLSVLVAGCGGSVSAPSAKDVQKAMQEYIGERDGSVDSKGRYKGPRVKNVTALKCRPNGKVEASYICAFAYDYIERKDKENQKTERVLTQIKVKVPSGDKEVERKLWKVVS